MKSCDSLNLINIPENQKSRSSGIWRDAFGRIYVPSAYWKSIVDNVHKVSHAGVKSTLAQIKLNYIFSKINKFVEKYVSSCENCQKSKKFKHTKPPLKSY